MKIRGNGYMNWKMGSEDGKDDRGKKVNFPDRRQEAELLIKFPNGEENAFTPLQFHFHAPSEHTVDGKHHDLEVHFVHYYKGTDDNM